MGRAPECAWTLMPTVMLRLPVWDCSAPAFSTMLSSSCQKDLTPKTLIKKGGDED